MTVLETRSDVQHARNDAMLVYIWEAWKADRRVRLRDLMCATGNPSTTNVRYNLLLLERDGLVQTHAAGNGSVYSRGPRLGGIYRGRPMRVIDEALP